MAFAFDRTAQFLEIYQSVVAAFELEYEGKFQEAIAAHEKAAADLKAYAEKKKPFTRKLHRRMLERQVEVSEERKKYLEALAAKEGFDNVVITPTSFSANSELSVTAGGQRPLSLDEKELAEFQQSGDGEQDISKAPESIKHLLGESIPPYSTTLDPSLPPTKYAVSHTSELVFMGMRSHWMYVKDETNTHTLYAGQTVWSIEIPIIEAVLRRASEIVPDTGALHVRIIKTPGRAFRLRIQGTGNHTVEEIPDREAKKKNWAPRRFTYGGRNFVWKQEQEQGLFKPFAFETLYETKRVWAKEGSRTGKKEDEVVGPRLAWTEPTREKGANFFFYFAGGLDQRFREHLLASQFAYFFRYKYPPDKDINNVEKAIVGAESVELGLSILAFLGT